jgi:ubiquinone/menaquinone biosynthesis C-methylase UbiE
MSEQRNFLDHLGEINAGFLHAYGETGTKKLLQLIDFKKEDTVLEIGFGTGTTLVKIASQNTRLKLYGVEQSEIMFSKAKQRIKLSALFKNISLGKISPGQSLPFDHNFFDKIIIESVLAIQQNAVLHFMLSEVSRVLKPAGTFYLNETVWLPAIKQGEIDRINAHCKDRFGIIQSNGTYRYRDEWKILLQEHQLAVLEIRAVKDIQTNEERNKWNIPQFISKAYSIYGNIRRKLTPRLRNESSLYKGRMKNIFEDKEYLEGIIIVASKPVPGDEGPR